MYLFFVRNCFNMFYDLSKFYSNRFCEPSCISHYAHLTSISNYRFRARRRQFSTFSLYIISHSVAISLMIQNGDSRSRSLGTTVRLMIGSRAICKSHPRSGLRTFKYTPVHDRDRRANFFRFAVRQTRVRCATEKPEIIEPADALSMVAFSRGSVPFGSTDRWIGVDRGSVATRCRQERGRAWLVSNLSRSLERWIDAGCFLGVLLKSFISGL